jgi:hypothetical protein
MVYSTFKQHDEFDKAFDFDRSFFGYHDKWEQMSPMIYLRNLARYIVYFGLFLNLMGI